MESNIKDNEKINSLITKFASEDNLLLSSLIILGCWNDISEAELDKIFNNSSDDNEIQAKILSILFNEEYEDVSDILDIKNKIIENNNLNITEFINNIIDEKFNSILDTIENLKSDDKSTKEILKSISNNEKLLNKSSVILLKLTEVLNDLTMEVNSIKPFIQDNSEFKENNTEVANNINANHLSKVIIKTIDLYFKNIHQDMLHNQNLFFNEVFNNKSMFSFKKNQPQIHLPNSFISEVAEVNYKVEDGSTEETSNNKDVENYKNLIEKIKTTNYKNDKDYIFDVFDLLKTGVFNKEQKDAVLKAVEEKLDKEDIIKVANPDNSAELMLNLIRLINAGSINKPQIQQREGFLNNRNNKKED